MPRERAPTPAPKRQAPPLYAAEEALRDVLSSRWVYVGTGPWPGNNRVEACVYRNARVLMVDAYCTPEESPAFRLEVYSPQRGRVRLYAEANGPVSALPRSEYFTFTAESEPPPARETNLPSLSLDMSFEELYDYEQRRYEEFLPSCYGGERLQQTRHNCLEELAPRTAQWFDRQRDFLQRPGDDWYQIVRKMRSLAEIYGSPPS